jgi:hypothetical protein
MEAGLVVRNEMLEGWVALIEVKVLRVHVEEEILLEGFENRIDTEKFRPLIMSFWDYDGFGEEKLGTGKYTTIDEEAKRGAAEVVEVEGRRGNSWRDPLLMWRKA